MHTLSPEQAALVGGQLAREHDTDALRHALVCRLFADGHNIFGHGVWWYGVPSKSGLGAFPLLAPLTVARLRVEGRGDIADALAALLRNASVDCDARLSVEEKDGDSIDVYWQILDRMRASGQGENAKRALSGRLIGLHSWLTGRLCADGHRTLEQAVIDTFSRLTNQESSETKPSPPAAPETREPPECCTVGEALARVQPADVLTHATVAALRAEAHDVTAGIVMQLWIADVVGPVAEPRAIVDAFVARAHAEKREELANTIDALLRDAPIDRKLDSILVDWQREVESPLLDSGPLAAALASSLRRHKKDALADSVVALMAAPALH
jgi:hypothetical protein